MSGVVVWVHMLPDDTAAAAALQANSWREDRARHWWDESKRLSRLYRQVLGLQGPAWDLYLLYGPGARWVDDEPPVPTFWMHQLSDPGADPRFLLCHDPNRLGHELDLLLQR
jgi:hypothetical protein